MSACRAPAEFGLMVRNDSVDSHQHRTISNKSRPRNTYLTQLVILKLWAWHLKQCAKIWRAIKRLVITLPRSLTGENPITLRVGSRFRRGFWGRDSVKRSRELMLVPANYQRNLGPVSTLGDCRTCHGV